MGLLGELLGGLGGQAMGGRSPQPPRPASGTSTGAVLMALLPIVLSMLSNRGSGRPGAPSAGGGLGDTLGQMLGGATRGGSAGGLADVLAEFQRAGFGQEASSWVSRGANKPISPDAITQVFGRDSLEQISDRAGLSPDEASRGLSELLPEVIHRVTPDGEIPDADALTRSVDDLGRRLGVG